MEVPVEILLLGPVIRRVQRPVSGTRTARAVTPALDASNVRLVAGQRAKDGRRWAWKVAGKDRWVEVDEGARKGRYEAEGEVKGPGDEGDRWARGRTWTHGDDGGGWRRR